MKGKVERGCTRRDRVHRETDASPSACWAMMGMSWIEEKLLLQEHHVLANWFGESETRGLSWTPRGGILWSSGAAEDLFSAVRPSDIADSEVTSGAMDQI